MEQLMLRVYEHHPSHTHIYVAFRLATQTNSAYLPTSTYDPNDPH